MQPLVVSKEIDATAKQVFEVIAHFDVAAKILPKIERVVILTDKKRGVGTRFAETRKVGKRQFTLEFEVTEYDAPHSVRFVSVDPSGTTWDSLFELQESDSVTQVTLTMHCLPAKYGMRLIWPLMKILLRKDVQADLNHFADHLACQEQPEL